MPIADHGTPPRLIPRPSIAERRLVAINRNDVRADVGQPVRRAKQKDRAGPIGNQLSERGNNLVLQSHGRVQPRPRAVKLAPVARAHVLPELARGLSLCGDDFAVAWPLWYQSNASLARLATPVAGQAQGGGGWTPRAQTRLKAN